LGAKFLVVLCAGSTLLVQSKALDEVPYKLSGAIAKLAGITFWSLALFPTGLTYLCFLLRENLLLCSSNLLLGFPNWAVIHIINTVPPTSFLAPLPGRKKKTSARGVSHAHPLLCFKFRFTLFLLASFYQK
jgi:hypothetical protein